MKSKEVLLVLFLLLVSVLSVPIKQPIKLSNEDDGDVVTLVSRGVGAGSLSVSVNTNTGAYSVNVDGATWLESPNIAFHLNKAWYSSESKTLKLQGVSQGKGTDTYLGAWNSVALQWNAGSIAVETIFKTYTTTQAIVFQVNIPSGAQSTNIDINSDVITGFPLFSNISSSVNYLTYQGIFGSPQAGKLASKELPGGIEGGPVFVFNSDLRTVGISPLDNFMVSIHAWSKSLNGDLAFGINGKVLEFPQGFSYSTILYGGQGVRDTVLGWGAALLGYYGKKPATLASDVLISTLGYWTDDGGYYWYNTEPNKDYQTTIIDVMDYIRNISLPVKNFQLDSWWYYKGKNDGVYTWTPQTTVFPNGMGYVQEHLKIPFALHNRYFSPDTPYQHNYTMVVESYCALPQDERLFYDIMANSKTWGNVLYEQDWLITTYEQMNVTQNNVTAGRLWLNSMGSAAAKLGMTIQYCMPLPLHLLQSVENQAVTQARASGDYVPGTTQWPIGYPSMLLWSLGLVPFRDDFWTTPDQPDCYNMDGHNTKCWEPNTFLMALTASLTAGPVGPSDKIGNINKTLLMYTSRSDGKLLKADAPVMPLDVIFSSTFDKPTANLQLWQSSTTISGLVFHYIFAAELSSPFTLQISDLPNLSSTSSYVAVDFVAFTNGQSSNFNLFDNSHPLVIPTSGNASLKNTTVNFRYYVAAPRSTTTCTIVGETSKFISVSSQRVKSISTSGAQVSVSLMGAPGEVVTFWFLKQVEPSPVYLSKTATLDSTGSGAVSCP